MPGPIDLHTHSAVSDGTQTPAELVAAAKAAGLGTVALTDHDSTAGWAEALAAGPGAGVSVIPGIELSTNFGPASVHMLGYLFDPLDATILTETARIRDGRLHRAERIVEKIGRDYDVRWADVIAESSPGTTLGRPHIADALVRKGIVADRGEAFQSILNWRGPYYEKYYAPSPVEGVRMIVDAGGVAVLAHPASYGKYRPMDDDVIGELADAGLFGLEVYHRDHTDEGRARLLALAARFGLEVTGSSDYHGAGKVNRLGENTTEPAVLEKLLARSRGYAPYLA
jgi:predicted metal-dependent phosphoesterase TrpH